MDKKRFGKKIKLARVESDLTQMELAKKVGLTQNNVSRYEAGISAPSLETLIKIAKTLNKPTSYFLDE